MHFFRSKNQGFGSKHLVMLSHECPQISVFKVSQTRQLLKNESQSFNFGNQTPFDQITHFFSSQIHSKVTPQYQ